VNVFTRCCCALQLLNKETVAVGLDALCCD